MYIIDKLVFCKNKCEIEKIGFRCAKWKNFCTY